MASFDDRQKGFENKYAHDQELQFKAQARRNKLLGLWAAEKMGLTGEAANDYAKTVVRADFDEPGDEDVFRKIRKDLDDKGRSTARPVRSRQKDPAAARVGMSCVLGKHSQ